MLIVCQLLLKKCFSAFYRSNIHCAEAGVLQHEPEWHYSTVCGFWQVWCATLYDIHLLRRILARPRCCSETRRGEPATQVSFRPFIQAASPTSHLYSHPSTNQPIHSLKLSLGAKQATSDFTRPLQDLWGDSIFLPLYHPFQSYTTGEIFSYGLSQLLCSLSLVCKQ